MLCAPLTHVRRILGEGITTVGDEMFVLKIGFLKLEKRRSIRKGIFFFNSANQSNAKFPNKSGDTNEKCGNEFHFQGNFSPNFENLNLQNLNNRQVLYYLGYCSKNKLLKLHLLNSTMKDLHSLVLNSVNCISTDFQQNKKNILNPECYQEGVKNIPKKPFFDIHDLVKVYLNICYINSYFFLKTKRENYGDSGCSSFPQSCGYNDGDKNGHMLIKKYTSLNEKKNVKKCEGNGKNDIDNSLRRDNIFIYTNVQNRNMEASNEFVCNEHVKNIFHLLSIFFLQNVNILNDHYLCRIFYGYNKSKFVNERYLNNLSFEIIKRIKKIRTYHLYLILMNSYYLSYVDKTFVKILLIHIVNKLSQLPCEAMCQVLPVVPLFIHSEKFTYKINVIYAKKIASFNQVGHVVSLFKKMVQWKMISQRNILITFSHLNKFMKVRKGPLKGNVHRATSLHQGKSGKGGVTPKPTSQTPHDEQMINNVLENFNSFDGRVTRGNDIKFPVRDTSRGRSKLPHDYTNVKGSPEKGTDNVAPPGHFHSTAEKMFSFEQELMRCSKTSPGEKNPSVIFGRENGEGEKCDRETPHSESTCKDKAKTHKGDNLLFNLKLIEMHLLHDFKNIYCLLPSDYKNFLQKIRTLPCSVNKNMQGEKEIYILKKYMKMLNYEFITFIHGPYVLHICDPFYKIYLEWENGWKLYPLYQQNAERHFRENKITHLRKEGFSEILICHDAFANCPSDEEKMNYLSSVLQRTKFSKCSSIICGPAAIAPPPVVSPDIYL
ncbi:conserved Plasmodium protein, unknown function [Plasmodium knowlesi strain H]|uniref:Uncharacterized protein n=3 Tax=Plasmodium knowlesi TaxID=5850 RepID=A0A5K1UDG6_PLAKH|nr:conserved protein, unknown function [Plasmodium knowlesi strain H]OTN63661.1 Uncharacterized protein PKNOH_S140249400 [Plasmodium knowlesi]CAA9990913.1 conserved protein, unknown function [Plasmodium knowlesi strain H]SBO20864.1 conserved Plasmodium protein, unknown function [Plasmodium knowlesi strain H]SBO21293.1 conserved Plasmodium protein, unknown function [Plasmodium knowlesi strain H]VVS80387.1 conserved protein, unknown function [Plasmodium knowlesi strain H]|eukprot:XP_002262198.1 hypothetical protein, conserved in Plasmodium species [Plasmodium knowlesi strain H]